MKKTIFLLLAIFISKISFAQQANDSLTLKRRNIVYIVPTAVLGNFPDVEVAWLVAGYDYRLNAKSLIGGAIGAIVYSQPSSAGGILGGFKSDKTNGFNLNLEHKLLLKTMKPYFGTTTTLYYATTLFYQNTKTFCTEAYNHQYYVRWNMYALTPEIGFMFINRYNLYTDIVLGLGLKYVDSKTHEKIGPLATNRETTTGKHFEYGSIVQPRVLVQYKIGYNF
jgi:hypothetical protein